MNDEPAAKGKRALFAVGGDDSGSLRLARTSLNVDLFCPLSPQSSIPPPFLLY
jgi:hypothetical protein